MFRTPSLRNVATRGAFFHNGRYHRLEDVLAFYALRDARTDSIYPRGPDGRVRRFDDLPAADTANVDEADGPFGAPSAAAGPLSARDRRDIIAFLRTLTDGYGGTAPASGNEDDLPPGAGLHHAAVRLGR
jgi:cytochrome c peroxidase